MRWTSYGMTQPHSGTSSVPVEMISSCGEVKKSGEITAFWFGFSSVLNPNPRDSTASLSRSESELTIAPPFGFRYGPGMSDTAKPDPNPPTEAERFREAMKQIMTVSKPEILRREAEAKEQRKNKKTSREIGG